MSTFDFILHQSFPEDQYIAEAVTLCFDGKYRVVYVRKKMKNGGAFWAEISASVTQDGEKKYLKSFSQNDSFLQEDIKSFLDNRSWEKQEKVNAKGGYVGKNNQNDDELPF